MKFILKNLLFICSLIIFNCCGIKVNNIEDSQLVVLPEKIEEPQLSTNHTLAMHYVVQQIDKAKSTSNVSWIIKNIGDDVLPAKGWTLYFNQIAASINEASLPNTITIKNVKGDFHKLQPTENFKSLLPGDSIVFSYQQNYPILRKSFLPSAPYLVYENGTINSNVKFNYAPFDEALYADYNVPTAQSRYATNKGLSLLDKTDLNVIIPTPASYKKNNNTIVLKDSIVISFDKIFEKEAQYLKNELAKLFKGKLILVDRSESKVEKDIVLKHLRSETNTAEHYQIEMKENIFLLASYTTGAFYAVQSLLQIIEAEGELLSKNKIEFNAVNITDQPQFDYRGLMIDVSRNFHRKETILEIIEQMAYYKLNKLHLHLTDDEGWRIEIEGLPELTDIGSKRGHTIDESENLFPFYSSGPQVEGSYGTGYFSKTDFIEILKYADAHHIEVIPEIDLPGHMRAAIVAMRARYHHYKKLGNMVKAEEYLLEDFEDESVYSSAQGYNDNAMCVCKESAFTFIEKVVNELAELYNKADVPFTVFHSGGDEVAYGAWQQSPVCKKFIELNEDLLSSDDLHAYTLKRLKKILAKHKVTSAGWEEIVLKHTKAGHQGIEIDTAFVTENVRPYVWNAVWGWGREDMTYKLANLGFKVVMCNSAQLYLDMAYNTDPNEIGLSWSGYTNTKSPYDLVPYNIYKTAKVDDYENFVKEKVQLSEVGKQNLLGIQGQVWSETLTNKEDLQYMLYPKMLALAERAWSSAADWDDAPHASVFEKQLPFWNEFTNRLGQIHLPKLDDQNINYRIPLPGAIIKNDTLYANVAFPGLSLKYTTDGSEPDMYSETYVKPVLIKGEIVKLKAFAKNGRKSRTSNLLLKE